MPHRASNGGPRLLLRRLREAMAQPGGSDARLNQAVRIIAANMVAEVCSVYLLRSDGYLELFATEGLNPSAVHLTRLRLGEGLVGDIAEHARPLALADAQAHPKFAYRPETSEEIFQSLLGVPILHGGRAIGVLVVQNRTRRHYHEEEIEALETISMVLAELIHLGQFLAPEESAKLENRVRPSQRIAGRRMAEGLAIGHVFFHEPRIEVTKTIADDVPREKERLEEAIAALRASVDAMLDDPSAFSDSESRDVLETYQMFAHDSGWLGKLHEAVETGLTAEAAVLRVQGDMRHRMESISDPYLRERLADLDDLAYRLLRHLTGRTGPSAQDLPEDAIILARNMGPAQLLDYDRSRLRGLALEEGSATAHVAIVARALGIPAVAQADDLLRQADAGDLMVLDGDHAQAILRPTEDVLKAFRQNKALRAEREAKYAAQRTLASETRDGFRIDMLVNAGLLVDISQIEQTGADGVGLFRTELNFMIRSTYPLVTAQAEFYRIALDAAAGRPVTFRTLDVGGDKILPYMRPWEEENPAMGWRAIRMALDRPSILKTQLRALLQAAGGRELNVMFPMVTTAEEFFAAKALLDRERARLDRLGHAPPSIVRVGTMLEVPSLAWALPEIMPAIDFVSIGSNDLAQFFFAADRGNPRLADRYDPLSPGLLRFLRWVRLECAKADKPVTVCGEMAGRPIEAMALIALGFRRLSMSANAIGPVKDMLRSLDAAAVTAYLKACLDASCRAPVRERLIDFAQKNKVVLA